TIIFHQIGVRCTTGLPIVLMASTKHPPLHLPQTQYIPFSPRGSVVQVRATLKGEIERVLAEALVLPPPKTPDQSPNKNRIELAERVETVAKALANLRINSLSEYVRMLLQQVPIIVVHSPRV